METIRNLTMKREGLIRDQNELNRQINKLNQDNENLETETAHLKLSKEQKEAEGGGERGVGDEYPTDDVRGRLPHHQGSTKYFLSASGNF